MQCPEHEVQMIANPTRFGLRWKCQINGCDYVSWNEKEQPQPSYVRECRAHLYRVLNSSLVKSSKPRREALMSVVCQALRCKKPRFVESLIYSITDVYTEDELVALMDQIAWMEHDRKAWEGYFESKQEIANLVSKGSYYDRKIGVAAKKSEAGDKWCILSWIEHTDANLLFACSQVIGTEAGDGSPNEFGAYAWSVKQGREVLRLMMPANVSAFGGSANFPKALADRYEGQCPWVLKQHDCLAYTSGMFVKVAKFHFGSNVWRLELGVFLRGGMIARDAFQFVSDEWRRCGNGVPGLLVKRIHEYENECNWRPIVDEVKMREVRNFRWEVDGRSIKDLKENKGVDVAASGKRKFEI